MERTKLSTIIGKLLTMKRGYNGYYFYNGKKLVAYVHDDELFDGDGNYFHEDVERDESLAI